MIAGRHLLYLDQNAWVALAQGAWDRDAYPGQHAALTKVCAELKAGRIMVPLSFTNIYETAKVNDPVRRANLARVQATLSEGRVLRGRRRILRETMLREIAAAHALDLPVLAPDWFLSDLWFEAVDDYSPATYGFALSDAALAWIREDPARALFDFLVDDGVRTEAVRRYSAGSAELIGRIEARRARVAAESFALRLRAYGAQLLLDELDFIFALARELGLNWSRVADIGKPLAKRLVAEIPVLAIERALVVRLEDQVRAITENDLRDLGAFAAMLPFADIVIAEKPFVNLARQAKLDQLYATTLLTSIDTFSADLLREGEAKHRG